MPEPYDFNFCFPVRELENDRIKLTPFIVRLPSTRSEDAHPAESWRDRYGDRLIDNLTPQPAIHADLFFQGSSPHPELFQYHTFGPYPSTAAFTEQFIRDRIQHDPGKTLYAIIDKTRSPPTSNASPSSADFAGIVGYTCGTPENLSVEIGFIIVLPPFQRTHVTTNTVGLLLQYALDLPAASPAGLGLRRVQWRTFEQNEASIKVAERMGFQREARLKWERVLMGDQGKVSNGEGIKEGEPKPGALGVHALLYAICWDDWENGRKKRVARLMDR